MKRSVAAFLVAGGGCGFGALRLSAALGGEEAAVELRFELLDERVGAEGAAGAGGRAETVEVSGEVEVEREQFLPLRAL